MKTKWFANIKLSRKMLIPSFITLGIFILLGISGHQYITSQNYLIVDLGKKTAEVESIMNDSRDLMIIHANLYKILSWYNTGYDEQKIMELVESQNTSIDLLIKKMKDDYEDRNQSIVELLADYRSNMKNAIEMSSTDLTLATTFVKPCEIRVEEINRILSELISEKKKNSSEALEKASESYRQIYAAGVTALTVSVFLICVSGYLIARIIDSELKKTIGIVETMAKGDLTHKALLETDDEFGRIARAVDIMGTTLGILVMEIHTGVETVVEESGRLSGISASLVEGVETINSKSMNVEKSVVETSVNIENIETSAIEMNSEIEILLDSVTGINASIKTVAENSQQVLRLTSKDAVGKIEQAAQIISDLNQAILKIDIIAEMIKEISEQINLLGLNATIEAVRAGEYGKGFGVVADEVKKLSKQTSQSAQEISLHISSIKSKSSKAVESVSGLSEFMQIIGEISHDVFKAIDVEKNAISEITSSISTTKTSSKTIADSVANCLEKLHLIKLDVDDLYKTSDLTAEASIQIKDTVSRFGDVTTKLKNNINRFKTR